VIAEAGNDPKVAGTVYITAFAPDKGESVATLSKIRRPAHLSRRYCLRGTAICFSTGRSSAPPSQPMWTHGSARVRTSGTLGRY
jgi:hypothetical protein